MRKAIMCVIAGYAGFLSQMTPSYANGVCPSVGADSGCGVTIAVGQTGATVVASGQPPYDSIEDTLIGVVNNSTTPISSLGLRSGTNIFGFDGDGITTYGIPGNSRDSSGYGGPNAYFNNIANAGLQGVVNFINPIQPGQTGYFSLEEGITTAVSIRDLVNGAVKVTATGPSISATFTPNLGFDLTQAAQIGGFINFEWVQQITHLPDPSPYFARNNGTPSQLTSASTPFHDPPAGGGYSYQGSPDNSYPFYWDVSTELLAHETPTTLSFLDRPSDPCLAGGNSAGVMGCNGTNAPAGSSIGFSTRLVGVYSNGSYLDLGVGFDWSSDYNAQAGGVFNLSTLKYDSDAVDLGGTGGATIDQLFETSSYVDPDTFIVETLNGNPIESVGSPVLGLPTPTPVPEPSTFVLFGSGILLLMWRFNNRTFAALWSGSSGFPMGQRKLAAR